MKHKTIKQALESVVANPTMTTDPIEAPIWQHVALTLFDIANKPDAKVRGSVARANRAQKIIFERLVGRRKAGTHPAQIKGDEIEFYDLTQTPSIEGDKS